MAGSTLKSIARRLRNLAKRPRGLLTMRRGRIASLTPLSRNFGADRGTPIDRLYIEAFLGDHARDVRGRVLEVTDDRYSQRFGGERVTGQDVLHRDGGNSRATITGDLAVRGTLPPKRFDCLILTQTLQYVFDLPTAVANIHRSLKPGGVALITVPGIGPACASQWNDEHHWMFTAASLRRLLETAFEPGKVSVEAYGNLYAATAFLHGAAAEDLVREKLAPRQPEFAILLAARAER